MKIIFIYPPSSRTIWSIRYENIYQFFTKKNMTWTVYCVYKRRREAKYVFLCG